jgi:hypothetical protein
MPYLWVFATGRIKNMAFKYRILAIDGGGIRGVIPAYILQEFEARLGRAVYQTFDIVAGTSTGGIISLGLTSPPSTFVPGYPVVPYAATQILSFYMNDEAQLFVEQASGDYYAAKYYAINNSTQPPTGIEPWLQGKLGSWTLRQACKNMGQLQKATVKQVLVTCYTMSGDKINGAKDSQVAIGPYLFNWESAMNGDDEDYCIWEAARATSAAPTFFPIARVGNGAPNGSMALARWAADGGVAANNPALYALAAARKADPSLTLDEIFILSLGTGIYNPAIKISYEDKTGNWGAIPWMLEGEDANGHPTSPLLNVLSMSNVLAPGQQLGDLMPSGNYYRLEPQISYAESGMDAKDVQALFDTAKNYIATGDGAPKFEAVIKALQAG